MVSYRGLCMYKTIKESVLEVTQVIEGLGDDPLHIIEDSGVRYTKYLKFANAALAQRVKEAAAKRDGVNLDVDGTDMYFPDEFTFNHIWYHYKVKIQPGKVSVETLDLPIGESSELGYSTGKYTTTHTVQAFRHVCDHYQLTIERNPSGVGTRTYLARDVHGDVVGNFMDGLGTFQTDKLVDGSVGLQAVDEEILGEVSAAEVKVGDAVKTKRMSKGTVLTVTDVNPDGWIAVEDSYGYPDEFEANELQVVVRPAVDPSKFKISGYKVKVLQQFKQVSSYGAAEYSNLLWLVGGDPQVNDVYLLIGVDPSTRLAIGNVFYATDGDFEDFSGRPALFANMQASGMTDMVRYFRIWGITTAMDESITEAPMDMIQTDVVNGRPVNSNSESLDPFDIWYYDAKGNDELPVDVPGMEEFCRRLWNAAVVSGRPSLAEGIGSSSPASVDDVWVKGDAYKRDGADLWTDGIHVGRHGNAIECHGASPQLAGALRDRVLGDHNGGDSVTEGMVLDVQQKMVRVEPSQSQMKRGSDALRSIMSMGGFSSTELRKYCAAVYSAMVGSVQVNQAARGVVENDVEVVDEAPSKPVTDVDAFLKMLKFLCGSRITLKDLGPDSNFTFYMRSPAKLILKSSDSWLPLMAITPDSLVDAGVKWTIADVVAFLEGKGIRRVKRPGAKRPTNFSMYDHADMSDDALTEGVSDIDLATRIDNFLATYAKLSANYDPEYDEADERWNGPDSAMLDIASKAIKAGQTPPPVHSDIGSGCYKDYQNPSVQQEHQEIVTAVNELANGQVTEAGPGSMYRRGSGWVILPATMALYGKRVVDITTAASEWAPHEETILVCQLENGRIAFLASSGGGEGFKVGETRECFHDQTQASKGMYKVLNIVVFRDGEIASKANEVGLNVKASVAVFK